MSTSHAMAERADKLDYRTQQRKTEKKRMKNESPVHFGHRHICSLLAIKKIQENPLFSSNLFYVQLSK